MLIGKTIAALTLGLVICGVVGSAFAVHAIAAGALQWPSYCIGALIIVLAAVDARDKWITSTGTSPSTPP